MNFQSADSTKCLIPVSNIVLISSEVKCFAQPLMPGNCNLSLVEGKMLEEKLYCKKYKNCAHESIRCLHIYEIKKSAQCRGKL